MIKDLFNGMGVKLDSSLKFIKPDSAFQFPGKDERLIVTGKGELLINDIGKRMNWFSLKDNQQTNFRIIDDVDAATIFIYRELVNYPLDEQPSFINHNELNLEINNKIREYKPYSETLLTIHMDGSKNLVKIYARNLDEDTQEYLWCEIANNKTVRYFIGVDIHNSQIIV